MISIGVAMRRAKSLLSIHLCSNPGSTPRVREFLLKRIRCIPEHTIVQFPIAEIIDKMSGAENRDILIRQLTHGNEAEGEKAVARETIKVK